MKRSTLAIIAILVLLGVFALSKMDICWFGGNCDFKDGKDRLHSGN